MVLLVCELIQMVPFNSIVYAKALQSTVASSQWAEIFFPGIIMSLSPDLSVSVYDNLKLFFLLFLEQGNSRFKGRNGIRYYLKLFKYSICGAIIISASQPLLTLGNARNTTAFPHLYGYKVLINVFTESYSVPLSILFWDFSIKQNKALF